MDKADVLDRMESARAEFDRLIVTVGETRMEQPCAMGDWSIKDILAHIMAYERWTAAQLNAAREGREATPQEAFGLDTPPPGADTFDLDERNNALRDFYRPMPLADIIVGAEHSYNEIISAVQALDDAQLADPAFLGWSDELTTAQIIGIQTWEHYQAHEPAIREWVAQGEGLGTTASS